MIAKPKKEIPSENQMQVPMEFLDKHGLNDKSDIHNFISNNQESANQLFNEQKIPVLPHEKSNYAGLADF